MCASEWHVVLVGSAAGGHGLGMGHGRACVLHTKSLHFRLPTLILTLYNCLPTVLIEEGRQSQSSPLFSLFCGGEE